MRARYSQNKQKKCFFLDCWHIHKWTENTIRIQSRFAAFNQCTIDDLKTYPGIKVLQVEGTQSNVNIFYRNAIHLSCPKCRFVYFTCNQRFHSIAVSIYEGENKHYIILLISFAYHQDWLHHSHTLINMSSCEPHTICW